MTCSLEKTLAFTPPPPFKFETLLNNKGVSPTYIMLSLLLLFPYILWDGEPEDVDKAPEVCTRKSSGPCYILAGRATDLPDPRSAGLSLPRGDAPRQRQLHLCSAILFREIEGKDNSRDTHTVTLLSLFRPSDIPFSYSLVQRIVFYLLSLSSSRKTWVREASDHSGQLLFPSLQQPACSSVASLTTEWGEKLWELAPA